jgi:hypothetical protein
VYRLFTTYYRTANPGRQGELDFALEANIGAFHSVYVYAEKCERPDWFTGYWLNNDRKKFADLLAAATANSKPGDVVAIANSDIVFTRPTLGHIEDVLHADEVYCLSRWDFVPGKGCTLFDRADSQDAWIFRGPPKPNIGGDFYFGMPGSDNKIAHELDAAGYTVLNPSRDIRVHHPHVSGERTSNKPEWRVPLPYLLVAPSMVDGPPRYERPKKLSKRAGSFQV